MPIDWGTVNWVYVTVLAVFVFLCSLVGSLLGFRRRVLGSVLSAALFAAVFVFWTWYPHDMPLPTRVADRTVPAAVPAVPGAPAGPAGDATAPAPDQ